MWRFLRISLPQLIAIVFSVDAESHPTFIIYCEININQAEHHSQEANVSVTAPNLKFSDFSVSTVSNLKIPSAITFLYSLSLWFNPTGHQGQDECKSREWQVIGRERKRNWMYIILLFIIQPPGYGTDRNASRWRMKGTKNIARSQHKLLVGIPHEPHKPSRKQNPRGNVPSEEGT